MPITTPSSDDAQADVVKNARLAALHRYGILDTPREAPFDDITRLAAAICRVPIAAISFVDAHRLWFKSVQGLDISENSLEVGICAQVMHGPGVVVIPDLRLDPRFVGNPQVCGAPGLRFYAGAALRTAGGQVLGMLCALDTVPHELDPVQHEALAILAAQVVQLLELRLQCRKAETAERVAREAQAELHEESLRKDEFLAMLAHELRNPLAPIRNAAQVLRLAPGDEPRVRLMSAMISRQVDHMNGLVDDMLDVSRVTRGLVMLESSTLDLREVITGALEQIHPQLLARRQRLSLPTLPEPLRLQGDRMRLVQVLSNLLNNAVKYTPEGGEIEVRVVAEDGAVSVSVVDNGVGIGAGLLAHVFELFTQGQRSPDRSAGGLGLGLALVKSLVELHGGSVAAHSAGLGHGSRFTVTLPRLPAAAREAALGAAVGAAVGALPSDAKPQRRGRQAAVDGAVRAGAAATSLRLMVVDDNADAAHTLALLLESVGHSVAVQTHSASALEQALAEPPDVVMLDIGMPGMDGYEMARRLTAAPTTALCTLVALTGYGSDEDRACSYAAGFDHHLVKPVDFEALQALLGGVVRR